MLVSIKLNGQIATVDVGANSSLAAIKATNTKNFLKNSSILAQAKNSLTTLKSMEKTYEEWTDAVRVVNSKIQTGKEILNIKNTVRDIGRDYTEAVELISREDALSYNQKEIYISVFTKILSKALSSLESGLDITKSGTFEMNDGERLQFIREIEQEVNNKHNLMLYALKRMKGSIQKSKVEYANSIELSNSIDAVKQ